LLRETLVETQPTLGEKAYTLYVSYQTRDIPSATVIVPVSQLYPDKTEEFVEQYNKMEGALYKEWLKKRNELIRKDLDERRKRAPSTLMV